MTGPAKSCAHWQQNAFRKTYGSEWGTCEKCGVAWEAFEVHGDFICPHWQKRQEAQ